MKKVFLILSVFTIIFGFVGTSVAARYGTVNITSVLTENSIVTATPGNLLGLLVTPDVTTSCTVTLYDNASAASGTIFWKQVVKDENGNTSGPPLPFPIPFSIGAYAKIETTGTCTVQVIYQNLIP